MSINLMPFLWVAVALIALQFLQRWIHRHLHGVALLITGNKNWAIILYAIILFPGVLLHEASHWLTAKILGVRTGSFSVIPKAGKDGTIQLGYVEYYKTQSVGGDGFKAIVPIQYGVNILEWNPGGENSLDRREGRTGSAQNAYCYLADPVLCSSNEKDNPITFFAYEWVNPRFGKKIKEVNVYGSLNYQAQQRDYGTVVSAPMPSNAILLSGISKVKKRESFIPGTTAAKK